MNKIYLIGPPYSGKSTTGQYLSQQMDWSFIDLDAYIEKREGKTIAEIFETDGEEAFRNMESKYLAEVSALPNKAIISCGGGTTESDSNMKLIMESGFVIYLNINKAELYNRMQSDFTQRPLFKGKTEVEKQQLLSKLIENRLKNYSKAKLVWNTDTQTTKFYNTVNQLVTLYSRAY